MATGNCSNCGHTQYITKRPRSASIPVDHSVFSYFLEKFLFCLYFSEKFAIFRGHLQYLLTMIFLSLASFGINLVHTIVCVNYSQTIFLLFFKIVNCYFATCFTLPTAGIIHHMYLQGLFKVNVWFFVWNLLHFVAMDIAAYVILYKYGTGWLPWWTAMILLVTAQVRKTTPHSVILEIKN